MKRNLLLGFLLLGLAVFEWGCGQCDDEYDVKTIGIKAKAHAKDSLELSSYALSPLDTIAYDTLGIALNIGTSSVKNILKLNGNSAYATPPCDPIPRLTSIIDSIKIFTNLNGRYTESTAEFRLSDNYRIKLSETRLDNLYALSISEYWYFAGASYLYYISKPNEFGKVTYKIQMFFKDEGIFETTTDPIIITP